MASLQKAMALVRNSAQVV